VSHRVQTRADASHAFTFRKEKSVKIIEYDLDPKKRLANTTLGVRRKDVLSAIKSPKAQKAEADLDEGIELSSDGSSASEDNEMEPDVTPESSEQEDEGEDLDEGVTVAKTASGKIKGAKGRNERVMSAGEVRAHLRLLFAKEPRAISLLYGRHGGPSSGKSTAPPPVLADMFFMDVIPVTPTRFRPAAKMGDELFENSQNSLLTAVITTCQRIKELNTNLLKHTRAEKGEMELAAIAKAESTRTFAVLLEAIIKLQHDVNSFMDSTKNPTMMRQGKLPPQGVKQLLEKKEGLFRKHMMVSITRNAWADCRGNV
jgi:DNA-directed RNA polymerase I subunit RPA1